MRGRLWQEMVLVKNEECYLSIYQQIQNERNRYFNISVLVLSLLGSVVWTFSNEVTLVTSILILAITFLKEIGGEYLVSNKTLIKTEKILNFYFDYYNSLENLWFEYNYDAINESELQQRFYKILEKKKDINTLINEVIKSPNKSVSIRAEEEMNLYFKKTFNL